MIVAYLVTHGTRPHRLGQLNRFGICADESGTETLFRHLKPFQQKILQNAGKPVPDDLSTASNLCSKAVREVREKRRKECDGPGVGFMGLSIGGVVGVGGVELPVNLDAIN